jgi:nicotinamide mononucleotide transporter
MLDLFARCVESMTWLEAFGFVTGVLCVYLAARENVWNWPIAIVNAAAYTVVFMRAGLYSDTLLQVVYLTLSAYGWYQWKFGGIDRTELPITRASPRLWLLCAAAGVVSWLVLSTIASRLPGTALPRLDAALTSASFVAQWMMTRKIADNWLVWMAADAVYVPMFYSKGLCLTSGLYAIFLILAVMGWTHWRRAMHREPAWSA